MYGISALFVIEILNKGNYTSLVVKYFLSLASLALVGENYLDSCVKECLLSHSGEKNIVIEDGFLKYRRVGLKSYQNAVSFRVAIALEWTGNRTSLKSLGISLAVTAVFNLKPLRESVNNRRADTVKTAGNLITLAAKLSARVKNGIYDLKCRKTELFVHTRWYSASVIHNRYTVILININLYTAAITGKCLVDRVINNLVNEVVKTAKRGRTYIHSGSFSNSLKSLKHLYLTVVIPILFYFVCHFSLLLLGIIIGISVGSYFKSDR